MFAWSPEISLESSCQLSFICNYLKNVFDQLIQWGMKNYIFPCIITVTLWLLRLDQKQPPEVFCWKRCSLKLCIIHRKTLVAEYLLSNVPGLWPATLLKKEFGTVFSNKFFNIFKNTFFTDTYGWLLLP